MSFFGSFFEIKTKKGEEPRWNEERRRALSMR